MWKWRRDRETYKSEAKARIEAPLRISRLVRNPRAGGIFKHGGFEDRACIIILRRLVLELTDEFGNNGAQLGIRHSASLVLGGLYHISFYEAKRGRKEKI